MSPNGVYYTYIITNQNNTTLYTGMTNNLHRRMNEHRTGSSSEFSHRYKLTKLVYFECWPTAQQAIQREKQIKNGSRKKKVDLIESVNPLWKDLVDQIGLV